MAVTVILRLTFSFADHENYIYGFVHHHQQNKWYPKGVYLPISKVPSILAVANLLAHNNKSRICYCGQILLQSAILFITALFLTLSWVPFILLAMVRAGGGIVPVYLAVYNKDGQTFRTAIDCFFFLLDVTVAYTGVNRTAFE